ncbi:MAG: sugar phosphate isomerase/epimerase family protein [bacterium]
MQIYLSTWCLKEKIQKENLYLEDLPELANGHGFSGIEIMDRQIPGFSAAYLTVLRDMSQKCECGLILDVSSDLTHAREDDWLNQINYVFKMLEVAKQLAARKVRILLGGQDFSFQKLFKKFGQSHAEAENQSQKDTFAKHFIDKLVTNKFAIQLSHAIRKKRKTSIHNESFKIQRAIGALQKIVPKAELLQIPLVIENHWGISCRPENILQIIRAINSPYLGTCPDFDNFPKEVNSYEALRALAPKALHVHAKSKAFTKNGEEKHMNYQRCLKILQECGYHGTVTIEYEGRGDALAGCFKTRDLILKYWDA